MQNNCLEEVEILLTLISEVCIVFFSTIGAIVNLHLLALNVQLVATF